MLRLKIKSEIRRRLYAAVSLGRSRVNSSVPNSQAKHKSFDRPAASAQRADAVLPYPTGVRRLSTRFNGVRGLLGGQRGEIRNLPWPPNKVFSFTQKKFLRVYIGLCKTSGKDGSRVPRQGGPRGRAEKRNSAEVGGAGAQDFGEEEAGCVWNK